MHQDDASSNQTLKQQKVVYDALPKIGKSFLTSLEGRSQGFRKAKEGNNLIDLQTYAEDELVRKDYKEMQCEMPRTPRSTFLMVFSPDGTKVASTHGNHNIYVTDLRTGKNIQTLSGHPRTPWCIAFHPTSNQIIASGCLGGQVRIWDLSGGSEVWTTETQTVIASLAFHPNERLLVIATYNELYFWDWSQPNPFLHTCTNNVKEKVRYVAFDRLGHKLITGIANTPQTRWERVRAPVPVPRQAERSASPYRRRITPRLVTNIAPPSDMSSPGVSGDRYSLAGIPERERRITVCYRNLVEQYELLVHRYLEIYRPATTIDRGTDPMEPYDHGGRNSSNANTSGPSTSSGISNSNVNPINNNSSRGNGSQTSSNAPLSNCGTQTFDSVRNASTESGPSGAPSTSSDAATAPAPAQPPDSAPESAAGPSGLNRFRSGGKRSFPPFNPSARRVQKHVRFPALLFSDSSSSDDEPSLLYTSKRRATDQTQNQSSGGSGSSTQPPPAPPPPQASGSVMSPHFLRTNTSDTGTTQSGHHFTIAQSHRGPGGNVPPFPCGKRRLYCHRMSAFSPTGPRPQPEWGPPARTPASNEEGTYPIPNCSRYRFMNQPVNRESTTEPPPINPPPTVRNRADGATPVDIPSPLSRLRGISEGMLSSADELINFAERSSGSRPEQEPFEQEMPSDYMQPSGATTGTVGNIYTSILSDLEYSLDNVRNMRVSDRSEATGVLSSFSQGLESIMSQSDAILRNLRQSLDMLLERDLEITDSREARTAADVARNSAILGANPNRARVSILRLQGCRIPPRSNYRFQMRHRGGGGAPPEEQNFYVRYSQHPAFPSDDPHLTPHPSFFRQTVRRSLQSPHYSPPDPEYARGGEEETADNVSPTQPSDLSPPSPHRNPIADHTYPRNPDASSGPMPSSSPDYIAPLVTSLHITISHISRQARLLRRQVESIERIDRAMVEVSQLQLIRQMWGDIRSILTNLSEGSRRVSSMRQMMAGTRISDSNPSSESSDGPGPSGASSIAEPSTPSAAPIASTQASSVTIIINSSSTGNDGGNDATASSAGNNSGAAAETASASPSTSAPVPSAAGATVQTPRHGSTSRKTYPPSRLCRLQRQNRRYQVINPRRRRPYMKFDRSGACRQQPPSSPLLRALPRTPLPGASSTISDRSPLTLETLTSMVQRLEYLLAEQTRNIGAQETTATRDAESSRRVRLFCERITVDRLTGARARIRRMLNPNYGPGTPDAPIAENQTVPSAEGISRMGARLTLSAIVDSISRFFEDHANSLTPAMRTQIKNVIELALLLTDIMLLQIVDSIPPPTGISLDPEREDLSARIDQMCSRMLANRLSSHSQQLTRSLRLMRLTARYASRALGITYQARRHALLPTGNHNDRRFELLNQINNCLRNMHRRRGVPFTPINFPQTQSSASASASSSSAANPDLPTAEWCQSVRELLTSFLNLRNLANPSNAQSASTSGAVAGAAAAVPPEAETPAAASWRPDVVEPASPTPPNNDEPEEPLLGFGPADDHHRLQAGPLPAAGGAGSSNATSERDNDDPSGSSGGSNSSSSARTLYRSPAVNLVNPPDVLGLGNSGLGGGNGGVSTRTWNLPTVQVNDMPVNSDSSMWFGTAYPRGHRIVQDIRAAANGLFRPRFLHPLYAGVNPFDADLDDPQREQSMGYDADMTTTVTPNHRIQVWDISNSNIPNISNPEKNIVVAECKIHNDASVDIAKDGTLLVTLLPSGGYLNVTNRLGVYSLRWETLGQCLFTTNFEQNAVSVSLSPLSRHLIVGLASRRVSLIPTDRWTIARIFFLDRKQTPLGSRLPVLREIDQNRDSNYMSVNCIRWMPISGQGLVYATNTGQLKVLS